MASPVVRRIPRIGIYILFVITFMIPKLTTIASKPSAMSMTNTGVMIGEVR